MDITADPVEIGLRDRRQGKELVTNSHFYRRELCPVCESDPGTLIFSCHYCADPIRKYLEEFYSGRVDFELLRNAKYELRLCSNCSAVWQCETPDDSVLKLLYGNWIDPDRVLDTYHKSDDLDVLGRYAQEVVMLISYFGKTPGELEMLDFGMGWGRWCLMAKAFGCSTYGTDLSDKCTEYVRSNGIKTLDLDQLGNFRFDFINTEQVFEHLAQPLKTLRYLAGVLKPNGLIKISVPQAEDVLRRSRKGDWTIQKDSPNSLNAVSPLEHLNSYRRKSIVTMAAASDLEMVKVPMGLQIGSAITWVGPTRILKNILRPLYLEFRKFPILFFRRRAPRR